MVCTEAVNKMCELFAHIYVTIVYIFDLLVRHATLIIAIIGMIVSIFEVYSQRRELFLSRQQFLFDRRMDVYNIIHQFSICFRWSEECLREILLLESGKRPDVLRTVMRMCNNSLLICVQNDMPYNADGRDGKYTDYCMMKIDLFLKADVAVHVFPGGVADSVYGFVHAYIDVVDVLYEYMRREEDAVDERKADEELISDPDSIVNRPTCNIEVRLVPVDVHARMQRYIESAHMRDKIEKLLTYSDIITDEFLKELLMTMRLK